MHALYVPALRPWECADTSTSHNLGSKARSYFGCPHEFTVGIFAYYNIIYSGRWVGIIYRLGVDLPEVDEQSPLARLPFNHHDGRWAF